MELRKFIATTIHEYLNESIIHSHDLFTINDIDAFKIFIRNKHNIELEDVLGMGSSGIAFSTSKNNIVFKLTTDKKEYNVSKKLNNKKNIHLNNYYDSFKIIKRELLKKEIINFKENLFNTYNLYGILIEKVDNLNEPIIKKIIDKMSRVLTYNSDWGEYLEDKNFVTYNRLKFYNIEPNIQNLKKFKWTFNQLNKIFNELEYNDIEKVDINSGNIGIKNNKLILYDIST